MYLGFHTEGSIAQRRLIVPGTYCTLYMPEPHEGRE